MSVSNQATAAPILPAESASACQPDAVRHVDRLSHIPEPLRIQVLFSDDTMVVISKPSHLRSVPGHARNNHLDPSQPTGLRKRLRHEISADDSTLSGQRAWLAALDSLGKDSSATPDPVGRCIRRLAGVPSLASSLPRKYKVFCRYIHRNRQRIMTENEEYSEKVARDMYERIQDRYRSFLPESTKPEESALGQLTLLGLGRTDDPERSGSLATEPYIVHRLDCETSGVMVFARTQAAAAALGQQWRSRNAVKKTYMAHVRHWPPFQKDQKRSGNITLPLKPSEERIKWQVCAPNDEEARPCETLWQVMDSTLRNGPVLLRLTPVTGRTHQLRIHCAAIGSGITGDTLYEGKVHADAGNDEPQTDEPNRVLRLHAHKLAFPHPESGEIVSFTAEPPVWLVRVQDGTIGP